ncbi:MAG: hypothetical protein AAGP08_11845, partial [Pseudomonadota bacterium]
MRDLTLSDFLADWRHPSMTEEWRGNWASQALYRWPGQVAAWVSYRLGLAPVTITFAGLFVALSLPLVA